ncbi:MAG: alpha/beta hydrolase, partial [Chloroflexota bacterium]
MTTSSSIMKDTLGNLQQETVKLASEIEITYYVGGEHTGEPVVLLHGGGTDHALLSWRDTIPLLIKEGYRVYAPNYPGYGPSPLADEPSTTQNLTKYLEELMDIWQLDDVALVGISMGGALSLSYTLRHSDRVRCVTLIGSYGIQDVAPFHHLSYAMIRMPWLLNWAWSMMRGSRWAARYTVSNILNNPEARTDAILGEVMEALNNANSQIAFSQWQRDEIQWYGLNTNFTDELHKLQVPVLLAHGTHDIGVPLKYAERAAEKLPHAQLEIFENAGHWTQRDYPEKFNTLLLNFLAEHP